MQNKFIIQVAPLVRLPITRMQVFSYLHFDPIERGSLVEIPFMNRVILGISLGSRSDFLRHGNFKLKNVKKIVKAKMISEKQIELAKKLADFYLSPLGIVLKLMVPKIAKIKERKNKKEAKLETVENNSWSKEIMSAKKQEFALIGPKKERDEIVLAAIKQTVEKNKQFLYLASEIFPAAAFFEKLKKYFPEEEIALVHGSISKGEIAEAWEKIRNGKAKIIVATKTGLFFPFCGLEAVFIEESGDTSHKQWDMSPRYGAVQAARMLADSHNAKIVYSSSVPSVEIWERNRAGSVKILDIGAKKSKKARIEIVNIFREKKGVDFPVGKELYKMLSNAMDKKKKALLVVNRKGFSSYSICRSCKAVLRCPDCDRALVYFEEKEQYRCLHCRHKIDLLSPCPSCGSCQFSHQGVGIQLTEKKIKRLFPSARVLRLDADASKSKKKSAKILKDLKGGNFDILIGTQVALKSGSLREFDLVSFPSFDDLGSISDFNSRELVFSMLNQAKSLLKKDGVLLIQTTYPDDFLLTSFQDQKQEVFFSRELKERKKMAFPPFSRLVKIFYREKDRKKIDAETQNVFNLLQMLANSNIEISDPYEPFAAKKRGYYFKNILLKAAPGADIRKLPVFPVLGGLKKGWTVDVDPISTI